MRKWLALLTGAIFLALPGAVRAVCDSNRVALQMLGTRGPELLDGRASTGYLIWLDGKARVIVDAGPGSAQNFKRSGARYKDVSLMLISHFHVDHSADVIAYLKGGFFTDRTRTLTLIGPSGNDFVASADQFVGRMIGTRGGAYPYLGGYIDPSAQTSYKIEVQTVPWSYEDTAVHRVFADDDIVVTAAPVHHGPFPALGYRVEMAGCALAFTGDMSGRLRRMPELAAGADILVAHNAVSEDAEGVPALLHMTPSYIGEMAGQAKVRRLLLTHLMERTVGREAETTRLIRAAYSGPVSFPDDLDVIRP